MDRQPGRLAGDVPQRDVEAPIARTVATRARAHSSAVEPLAVERVLVRSGSASESGSGRARRGSPGSTRCRERRAPSMPSSVTTAQQAEIAFAGRPRRVVAVDRRRDALPGEQGQRDIGDLHWGSSRWRRGSYSSDCSRRRQSSRARFRHGPRTTPTCSRSRRRPSAASRISPSPPAVPPPESPRCLPALPCGTQLYGAVGAQWRGRAEGAGAEVVSRPYPQR